MGTVNVKSIVGALNFENDFWWFSCVEESSAVCAGYIQFKG